MGYLGKNNDFKIKNVILCSNKEEGPKWLFWLQKLSICPNNPNLYRPKHLCTRKFLHNKNWSHESPLGYFGSLSWVPLMECFQKSIGLVLQGPPRTSFSNGRFHGRESSFHIGVMG